MERSSKSNVIVCFTPSEFYILQVCFFSQDLKRNSHFLPQTFLERREVATKGKTEVHVACIVSNPLVSVG